MPSRERVEAFVASVVSNDHVRAIEEYYTDDAATQENGQAEVKGREALLAKERGFLARMRIFTHGPRAVLVDGDRVAIYWVFDVTDQAGVTRRREELALQTWRGDRILWERFFYDPAETVPI